MNNFLLIISLILVIIFVQLMKIIRKKGDNGEGRMRKREWARANSLETSSSVGGRLSAFEFKKLTVKMLLHLSLLG